LDRSSAASDVYKRQLQNSARPSAGFNLGIVNSGGQNAGTLGTVSGQLTQLMSSQLTHTQPKSLSGGSVSWQFTWQAPSTPGQYTVRAVGNAVNSNGNADANDQWNFLQSVTITVKGLTITAPTPSQILCAGATVTLQWTSYGITSVVVAISSDGGNSFTPAGSFTSQDGQNSQNFTIPSTLPPGDQYRIRLIDASDNTIFSTTQNLTLAAPTTITAHPQSASACEGASVSFSVTATGSNLTYQWRRNGTNITGATQATLALSNITQAQAGSYDCVVGGACGQPVTSNTAVLTISPQTTITAHPQSTTVCQGASVTFTVAATGNNLRYQWKKGTQDIAGATNTTYTIATVALADTGFYSCTVSGDCGSPTSNQAQLQVAVPPAIATQPQSRTLCEGQTLTLTVGVNRAIANIYQWKKNGTALSDGGRIQGTRTATLQITNTTPDDAGIFTVEITNSICQATVTSDPVQVTIEAKPNISSEPESKVVPRGSSVSLSVTASGSNLRYQWHRNGQPIPSATSSTYAISSVQDSDAGTYHVVISNDCGSVQSRQVTVTVTNQPTPILELSRSAINFLGIRVGTQETARLVVYNRGTALLHINRVSITGNNATMFSVALTVPATIPSGDSLVTTASYTPTADGTHSATLTIESDGGTRQLSLTGHGFARAITPETAQLDSTELGSTSQQTIRICNQTAAIVHVDSVTIEGDDAIAFELVPGQWQQDIRSLQPASTPCVDVSIAFRPIRAGNHRAQLVFHSRQLSASFADTIALGAVAVQSASIVDIGATSVRVLPNPASDAIVFEIGPRIAIVRIFDSQGATVHTATIVGTYWWDLRDGSGRPVGQGIYHAMLELGTSTISTPIVIVR
ncbi:MAG: immunoglobulin domain-containing protein, partial [Chlorobi bacterium]|nr:immunoglobulin domain-containing protein [Chlorobiota bacterium]